MAQRKPTNPPPATQQPPVAQGKPAATGKAVPPKPKERFLTEEELKDLQDTFDLFDEDKSGTIDPQEIKKVLEDLGLNERNPIIYKIVTSLEGFGQPVNFDQFVDIVTDQLGNNKSREGAAKLFELYDPQGEGFINFDKLKAVAKELGETMNNDELQEMIHHIHILRKTQDPQQINFDEFYEIITAPRRY
ncbi:hypothetical protein pb186bvf_004404 [Paramecium bursaria]